MPLERAVILQAALQLLDQSGLDGLTMRRLADALGVKAPSIYWHYPGKPALLVDMVEALLAPVATDLPPDLGYREVLRRVATDLRRGLLAHRDGALLLSGRFHTTPDRLRLSEIVLGAMMRKGIPAAVAAAASFSLFNYVLGFVVDEQALARDAHGNFNVLRSLPVATATQYPAATAALANFADADRKALFDDGIAILLAGLERSSKEDEQVERLVAVFKSLR